MRRGTLHSILVDYAYEKDSFLPRSLPSSSRRRNRERLIDLRQLTHGGQNAEAYWSPDGKRLIFQTTRPPYECDQMFIMNADGSDQHLVSTGKGRTTCGYFLADNQHIVYASTHLAGDACPDAARSQQGLRLGRLRRLRHFSRHRRRQDREAADRHAGLRRRGDGELEDRQHRVHVAGVRRPGPVDDEDRRLRQEADHEEDRATTAARCSRATARSWSGARITRRPRRTWSATSRCWRRI